MVEYVKGELRLHNNTKVGVMTNDPTWDWHLQNLNNYGTHIVVHADGWTDNRVVKPHRVGGPETASYSR